VSVFGKIFRPKTIVQRLTVNALLNAAFVFIIAGTGIYSLYTTNTKHSEVSLLQKQLLTVKQVGDLIQDIEWNIRESIEEQKTSLSNAILGDSENLFGAFDTFRDVADRTHNTYDMSFALEYEPVIFALRRSIVKTVNHINSERFYKARTIYKHEVERWAGRVSDFINESSEIKSTAIETKMKDIKTFESLMWFIVGGISLFIVFFNILLNRKLSLSISESLTNLVNTVQRIGEGNFAERASVESQDEIGDLAIHFNQMTEALENSMAYTDNILHSMGDMLIVLNLDGTIRTINTAGINLLGYEEGEFIGKHLEAFLEKKGESPLLGEMTELTAHIKKERLQGIKVIFLTKQNERISTLVSGNTLKDAEERVQGIVLSATDMREQLKLQAQATQNEKLASIGELAAGVGHEINNPLAIATGNLSKAIKELKKPEMNRALLQKTFERQEESLERIRVIVDSLRTYARMDTEQFGSLDIHELINKTVGLVATIYEREGIQVKTEFQAKQYTILGNTGKFQQVLMNLISNAKDATEGRENREIIIRTENDQYELAVSISDLGSGISDEIKEKIFDNFFTTKEVGKGTGMGLGISKKIIEEMEGGLEVDSKVGVGTTFTINFPLTQEQETETRTKKEQRESTQLSGRALILDDEEGIRELLRETLEDLGLEVDEAAEAFSALEKVKTTKYDYILTDMKMPGMSGDKFIEQARKLPNGNTRYFVITGGVTTEFSPERRAQLHHMIDGFLLKPFTDEMIYEALSKHLQGKKKAA